MALCAAIGVGLVFFASSLTEHSTTMHFLCTWAAALVGFALTLWPLHLYRTKLPKKWQCRP